MKPIDLKEKSLNLIDFSIVILIGLTVLWAIAAVMIVFG
jgi:hypothetical protein